MTLRRLGWIAAWMTLLGWGSGSTAALPSGEGRSEVLWSFEPPDGDAAGWTRDLRAVLSQPRATDSSRH